MQLTFDRSTTSLDLFWRLLSTRSLTPFKMLPKTTYHMAKCDRLAIKVSPSFFKYNVVHVLLREYEVFFVDQPLLAELVYHHMAPSLSVTEMVGLPANCPIRQDGLSTSLLEIAEDFGVPWMRRCIVVDEQAFVLHVGLLAMAYTLMKTGSLLVLCSNGQQMADFAREIDRLVNWHEVEKNDWTVHIHTLDVAGLKMLFEDGRIDFGSEVESGGYGHQHRRGREGEGGVSERRSGGGTMHIYLGIRKQLIPLKVHRPAFTGGVLLNCTDVGCMDKWPAVVEYYLEPSPKVVLMRVPRSDSLGTKMQTCIYLPKIIYPLAERLGRIQKNCFRQMMEPVQRPRSETRTGVTQQYSYHNKVVRNNQPYEHQMAYDGYYPVDPLLAASGYTSAHMGADFEDIFVENGPYLPPPSSLYPTLSTSPPGYCSSSSLSQTHSMVPEEYSYSDSHLSPYGHYSLPPLHPGHEEEEQGDAGGSLAGYDQRVKHEENSESESMLGKRSVPFLDFPPPPKTEAETGAGEDMLHSHANHHHLPAEHTQHTTKKETSEGGKRRKPTPRKKKRVLKTRESPQETGGENDEISIKLESAPIVVGKSESS